MNKEIEMITDREEFIKICGILAMSDTHPTDCNYITKFIVELGKENKELKRNCNIGNENLSFYRQENKELHNKIDKTIDVIHTQMKNNPSYKENLKIIENNLIKGSCKVCDLKDSDVDD